MPTLLHVDLAVRDLATSMAFYVDRFGCTVVDDAVVTGAVPAFYSGGRSRSMRLVLLKASAALFGVMIELMEFAPGADGRPILAPRDDSAIPTICNLTFMVDDMTEFLGQLANAGVTPIGEPLDIELPKTGAAKLVFVRDPDGNLIELVERARPAARSAG